MKLSVVPVVFLLHSTSFYWFVSSKLTGQSTSSSQASSSLLQLHKLYLQQPPHDTALYDRLEVSPNATAREITQSYRRLCKRHHPDKTTASTSATTSTSPFGVSSARRKFDQLQEAYQVLKDDTTRLVYHRFGAVDSSQAVVILTGSAAGTLHSNSNEENQHRQKAMAQLLRLMGYPPDNTDAASFSSSSYPHHHVKVSRQERVWRIACQLLEQLRVVVEGQVSLQTFLDSVIQECDALKRLPLGAQILRCVGRSYRHAGQKALGLPATERVREGFRDVKHLVTALVASGRVFVAEQRLDQKKRRWDRENNHRHPEVVYHFDDELGELTTSTTTNAKATSSLSSSEGDMPHHQSKDQDDLRHEQHVKTQSTLLESLQVEALWKVTKIELDKVVRQACELILQGDYFFVDSSSNPYQRVDGWVGYRSDQAVDADMGRQRAAETLIQIGNVMVEQSKEGTSWLE